MTTGSGSQPLFAAQAASGPQLLPAGFLSARDSQIVGPHGRPVRIACVGAFGTVIVGGRLDYSGHYNGPLKGLDANVAAVRAMGFNCLRVDFTDKSVDDPVLMSQFDQLVPCCAKHGLKVIFDNHNNEATPASWANAAQCARSSPSRLVIAASAPAACCGSVSRKATKRRCSTATSAGLNRK